MKEKIFKILKVLFTIILVFCWLVSCTSYNSEVKKTKELETQIAEKDAKIEELNKSVSDLEAKNKEQSEKLIEFYDKDIQSMISNYSNSAKSYAQSAIDLINDTDFDSSDGTILDKKYECPYSKDVISVKVTKPNDKYLIKIYYSAASIGDKTLHESRNAIVISSLAQFYLDMDKDKADYDFAVIDKDYYSCHIANSEIVFFNRDGSSTNEVPDWVNEFFAHDKDYFQSIANDTLIWITNSHEDIANDIAPYIK